MGPGAGPDATAVQPRPLAGPPSGAARGGGRAVAGPPGAPLPPPPRASASGGGPSLPPTWVLRSGVLAIVAFVLGAGIVVALAVLASPAPPGRDGIPAAQTEVDEVGDAQPARTLPPTTTTTTTLPPTTVVTTPDGQPVDTNIPAVTEPPTTPPTPAPKPRTTRRLRGWFR